MPRPLSEDLRVRLVEAVQAGGTIRAVGERFGVAPSSVSKIDSRNSIPTLTDHKPDKVYKRDSMRPICYFL